MSAGERRPPLAGTLDGAPVPDFEARSLRGITCARGQARVELACSGDREGLVVELTRLLAELDLRVDMLCYTQGAPEGPRTDVAFTLAENDLLQSRERLAELASRSGDGELRVTVGLAKVSLAGAGLRSDPEIAALLCRTLAERGIAMSGLSVNELQMSCLLDEGAADEAVRALQDAFGLAGGGELATVVQPFPVIFARSDVHVMLFFEGHPTYESAEAMINDRPGEEPLVVCILTRRDQTQVDYTNDPVLVEQRSGGGSGRPAYLASIRVTRTLEDGRRRADVKLVAAEGWTMDLDVRAAGELGPWVPLVDPGGHARATVLAILSPDLTTLAAHGSRIAFDGVDYPIAAHEGGPAPPDAVRGSYTEGYRMAVFVAGREVLHLVEHPAALKAGERLVYLNSEDEEPYTLTRADADGVLLESPREQIELDRTDGALGIRRILFRAFSSPNGRTSTLVLRFEPPVPLGPSMPEGGSLRVAIGISIDDRTDLITGVVTVSRSGGELHLLLAPEKPEWTKRNSVSIRVAEAPAGWFTITSEVVPTP